MACLLAGFHLLVHFLCVRGVRDTQCGKFRFLCVRLIPLLAFCFASLWYVLVLQCTGLVDYPFAGEGTSPMT